MVFDPVGRNRLPVSWAPDLSWNFVVASLGLAKYQQEQGYKFSDEEREALKGIAAYLRDDLEGAKAEPILRNTPREEIFAKIWELEKERGPVDTIENA